MIGGIYGLLLSTAKLRMINESSLISFPKKGEKFNKITAQDL